MISLHFSETSSMERTILVIDDDKINTLMLTKRLGKRGFNVVVADSGHDGLRILEEKKVDLVILDIMIADIDGREILARIREKHNASVLPVIIVTAKDDTNEIINILKDGASDYLLKPVNIDVATARINNLMQLVELGKDNVRKGEMEALSAMIATYNHEINNPLTIAIGFLDISRKKSDNDMLVRVAEALQRVAEIVASIDRIAYENQVNVVNYADVAQMIDVHGHKG